MRRLRADCSARRRFNAPRVRRALGGALTAFLVAVWQFVAVPAPAPVALTAASVLGAAALLAPDGAEARSRTSSASRSSSSGGYSRSSSSSSSRTPSYSSSSRSSSASDKAISRANSAKALDSYRRSQEPPAAAAPSRAAQSTSSGGGKPGKSSAASADWPDWLGDRPAKVKAPRRPSADVYAPYRRYDPRWTPPAFAQAGPRSFGIWDAAMLWFLLDTFNRPGHAAFFHDNGQDPGLQQWRAEAERMAQSDPALQTRLASLDKATASLTDSPPQPGRLPESVADKFEPVTADDGDDDGLIALIIGLIVLVVVIGLMIYGVVRIVRVARGLLGRVTAGTPPSGAKAQQGDAALFNLFGGKDKARAAFRVGMTVTIDPTPFLLAGDAIKAQQPPASPGGLANAQGIGALNSDALTLHRIYLSDGDFLQIHLDDDGKADECRLFHVIDEIDPPDEKAWKEWLDKRDGMIGWRDFKTPDGKTYERAWSPGAKRVAPVKFHESEDSAKGLTLSKYECMLYRADTGLEAPAPTVEYLLVSVVERDGQAWVEIAAGIDVNPASLSLT